MSSVYVAVGLCMVATNDHLLRELEDTKEKHAQEIQQMNMNYEHLRKTIDLMRHV